MKQFFPILFLITFFPSINAQPIDWDAVIDRYVEKYQPEEIPAWLFPIIFKDATGAMDTIYFGYDEEASAAFPLDTIFSEIYVFADSSQFNAFWSKCPPSLCDSLKILDINITGNNVLGGYFLNFRNGLLPVTMYFDVTLLSDEALPLPDQSPNPRAQINIKNGWPFSAWSDPNHTFPCDYHDPLLITDNSLMGEFCIYSDSIEFIADPDIADTLIGFSFRLLPWTGLNPVSNKELENDLSLNIYPNPVNNELTIETDEDFIGKLILYDLFGNSVSNLDVSIIDRYTLQVGSVPSGIYLLYLNSENSQHTYKISIIK